MKPSGTPKVGRWFCPFGIVTLQRSAIEHRVPQRLRMILEHRGHLLGRLEEELIAGVAQALRIVDGLAGPDAEQDVVRLVIALLQVMHVVGADERQVEIARERQRAPVDDLLLLDALVLHLEEEIVRAENVAQPPGRIERGTRLFDLQRAGNFPFRQLLRPISPFECLASSSLSMRGR